MGLQNYTYRLKPKAGDTTPINEVTPAQVLSGATITLVDRGGGDYAWQFSGGKASVALTSQSIATALGNTGGFTVAIRMRQTVFPAGYVTLVGVGSTADLVNNGCVFLGQNGIAGALRARGSAAALTANMMTGETTTTERTHVLRVTVNAATDAEILEVWSGGVTRTGNAANYTSNQNAVPAFTLATVAVDATASNTIQIKDFVIWPEVISDANCAAMADNGVGSLLDVAATAVTLAGPTTGTVGAASTNFTVGANGIIGGTVTVTPNDGGGGGSFSPASVNISAASPTATFTYTAASSGAKTIGVTNNASLTNPSTIAYTASASAATATTISGPASGTVGSASTNFTVGANGAISGTIAITPSDGGAGGTFSPTTVTVSSASPTATFTYTPSSTGTKTISTSNNGGLTNPAAITFTANAAAATAVTLTGPTSGAVGSPSTNFTVGANGAITGTITVTPNDGGAGGTFSPASVNISAGTPTATFTYTAASTGNKTVAVSNNGSLANPTSITYAASGAAATAVTLTGPSSGPVGSASTVFTVGANGVISGTVTVTPSSSAGGTFNPASVTISSASPTATFTYTPASSGSKTISVANNASLTNPGAITYNATAVPTITSQPIKDEYGVLLATTTIPKVAVLRVSDMGSVLTLTNQPTDSSGVLSVTNAALASGTDYLLVLCDATGANVGCKAYKAL